MMTYLSYRKNSAHAANIFLRRHAVLRRFLPAAIAFIGFIIIPLWPLVASDVPQEYIYLNDHLIAIEETAFACDIDLTPTGVTLNTTVAVASLPSIIKLSGV